MFNSVLNLNIFFAIQVLSKLLPIKYVKLYIKLYISVPAYDNDEYGEPESNEEYDIDMENAVHTADVKGTDTKLVTAQKKGQSEYVGFIEPKVSNQMKHREILKKRVDEHETVQKANLKPMLHLGNFLSLGMCCQFPFLQLKHYYLLKHFILKLIGRRNNS